VTGTTLLMQPVFVSMAQIAATIISAQEVLGGLGLIGDSKQ